MTSKVVAAKHELLQILDRLLDATKDAMLNAERHEDPRTLADLRSVRDQIVAASFRLRAAQ